MQLLLLILLLTPTITLAADQCPIQLQEAQLQITLSNQSRVNLEQQLAQAIRVNKDLVAEIKKLKDANDKKHDTPKPE